MQIPPITQKETKKKRERKKERKEKERNECMMDTLMCLPW
jgi:hypothetical protein